VARRPEVEAWLDHYDNPMKDVVLRMRDIVLDADPRLDECIKWQAPTFTYKGNIASFYPKTRTHASLMFHRGAALPDPDGLLEGEGEVSRIARFLDADDLAAKRDALQELIRAWIAQQDGG